MISTTKTNFDLLQDRGSVVVSRPKNDMSVFEVENDDTLRLQNIIVEGVPFTIKDIRDLDNIKQLKANTYGYYPQDPGPVNKFYILLNKSNKIIPGSIRAFFRDNANIDPDDKKFSFRLEDYPSFDIMLSKREIEEKLIVERVKDGGSRRSKKYLDRSKTKKSKRMGSTARRALLKKRK